MASVRSSKNSTGSIGSDSVVDFATAFTGRVEKIDVFSTLTSTASLLSNAAGYGQTAANATVVQLAIWLGAIDPTDSLNKNIPAQANSTPGGGLVPTQDQLDTFFVQQLVGDPVSATFSTANNLVQEAAVTIAATETFLVVQAYSVGGLTVKGRVETYLMETVLPTPHNVKSSALPSGAATAALQTAGNNTLASINGYVQTVANKTIDTSDVTVSTVSSTINVSDSAAHTALGGNLKVINPDASTPLAVANAALADTINSSKVDVNIASGGFDGAVTNAALTSLDDTIRAIGSATAKPNTLQVSRRRDTQTISIATFASFATQNIDLGTYTAVRLMISYTGSASSPPSKFMVAYSLTGASLTYRSRTAYTAATATDKWYQGNTAYYGFNVTIEQSPRYLQIQNADAGAMTDVTIDCVYFS